MFLLDTNIVSDAYKSRVPPVVWLRSIDPASAFLSVITLGEIHRGVVKARAKDITRAERLASWLEGLRLTYSRRILPITEDIAIRWGSLTAGRTVSEADGFIAATALVHGLSVVTRNVSDFERMNVNLINPWAD